MSTIHYDRKRKRAPSSSATTSDKVINPLSHTPDTLKQFARAGYPAEQPLPSEIYPGFPHRGPNHNQNRQAYRWRNRVGPIKKEDEDDGNENGNEDEKPAYRSSAASDGDDEMFTDYTSGDLGQTTTDAETEPEPELAEDDGREGVSQGKRMKQQQQRKAQVDRKAKNYQSRIGCLAAIIRRCLAEGDIPTAKRAFGMLARAKVRGRKVDLRYQRFWEMGAEILMREGEASSVRLGSGRGDWGGDEDDGADEEDENARLAREAENLGRLKGYYEYLIQQYPFSKQHPNSTNSVLDFQVALFSSEVEAVYAAHRRGLKRLERGEGEDGDEDVMDVDDDEPMDYQPHDDDGHQGRKEELLLPDDGEDHLRGLSRQEIRRREREESLRLAALQRMLDIAQRMDTVMETVPFSRDHELLRLRAMVALYIGDLFVPPAPRSKMEDTESKRSRGEQRRKARGFLRRIKESGGVLKEHDECLLESLPSDEEGEDGEEDEGSGLPMFSSMEV
ncbi:RNA polymerase I-specific transcription initiation factor rrn11 [Madurella fahalii]|uniref:RNA polymerase I-specific transcription initiation factor rrn11 n=1 Tax=Madurella fahalii TaxID=1157608 RepID=A0ABQ0GM33_9PEZI